MTVKCVIFDCDGTLVDSEILCNLGLEIKFKELGIEIDVPATLYRFRGWKLADIINTLSQEYSIELDESFVADYRQVVSDLFDTQLQPIPNVAFALAKIPQPKCVASNAPHSKIAQAVKVTNLECFFSNNLFSSYTIQAWKPKPDLFLYAAKMMGVSAKNCVVVEDSLLGIEAAQSAGMRSFLYQGDRVIALQDKITLFDDMLQLPDLIAAS